MVKICSTGVVGENALKKLGGISQEYFKVKGLGGVSPSARLRRVSILKKLYIYVPLKTYL